MRCKLCLEEVELQESHIVPKCFYKKIRDRKGRLLLIDSEGSKPELSQDGIKEELLCKQCEGKLGNWENCLKKDLVDFGEKTSNYLSFDDTEKNILKIEKIRYERFKLGTLSILWRMSISSNKNFSNYNLGSHQEKLRKILKNEELVDEKKYPIMIWRYEVDGVFYPDIMMFFSPSRYEKTFTVQSFMIWGHMFFVFVNDCNFPNLPLEAFLRNSGNLNTFTHELADFVSPTNIFSRLFADKDIDDLYAKMK